MADMVEDPGLSGSLALGPLAGSLGFLLRISQLAVFEKFYEELGDLGLRPGEFSVLWLIQQNPGVRQGLVARSLHIKNARMTKLIRGFEESGYLTRRIPDDDRRAVELTLTPKGLGFVDGHRQNFFTYYQSAGTNLSAAEMAELIGLLQKFIGLEQTNEHR